MNLFIIVVYIYSIILYSYEICIEFELNFVYYKNIIMLFEFFVIVWQLVVIVFIFNYDINCNINILIIYE